MTTAKHKILIVGGGTAGITVAARLLRRGHADVAVIEPSDTHYYQPLWTLVGGGLAQVSTTERSEASVMPKGVTGSGTPAAPSTRTTNGDTAPTGRLRIRRARVCPGIQLDWNRTEDCRTRSVRTGCRRTTGSTLHPAHGTSSAACVRAVRYS